MPKFSIKKKYLLQLACPFRLLLPPVIHTYIIHSFHQFWLALFSAFKSLFFLRPNFMITYCVCQIPEHRQPQIEPDQKKRGEEKKMFPTKLKWKIATYPLTAIPLPFTRFAGFCSFTSFIRFHSSAWRRKGKRLFIEYFLKKTSKSKWK